MDSGTSDILQGTLDMMVLKALSIEPMHGWGIAQRLQQVSDSVFQVNQGSLYPALHKLEREGWISSSWGVSENNRRARFYRLTAKGRRSLAEQMSRWRRFAGAVEMILAMDGKPA